MKTIQPMWRWLQGLCPGQIAAVLGLFFICFSCNPARAEFDPSQHDLENIIYLELKFGRVVIKTYPEDAPNHVARIKELVRQGFYNGLKWHRVLPEFMAQTGDPRGDGSGGSGQNLKAEFNDRHHLRGTVSMARGRDEDSADSQFFIMFLPKFALDGNYTVWGRVIDGMVSVDAIKKGSSGFHDGEVLSPDKIVSMNVAADIEKNLPKQPKSNLAPIQPRVQPHQPRPVNESGQVTKNDQKNPAAQKDSGNSSNPGSTDRSAKNATANYQISAPQVPLPQWPIEPPQYDAVFPPIPQGGYMPY